MENKRFVLKLRLANEGEYERAACICVFNNDFDKAIEILLAASKKSKISLFLKP